MRVSVKLNSSFVREQITMLIVWILVEKCPCAYIERKVYNHLEDSKDLCVYVIKKFKLTECSNMSYIEMI